VGHGGGYYQGKSTGSEGGYAAADDSRPGYRNRATRIDFYSVGTEDQGLVKEARNGY
jgi:hypothetical protein